MNHIDIVFDGGPGPEAPKFIEVEDERGRSINIGDWVSRGKGFWALRIKREKFMDPSLSFMELLLGQDALQAQMGHPTGAGEAGFKENMLHAIVEITEALRETNFKPWKSVKKPIDRDALATEMTDILQFWANAALCMGLTPTQLTLALRKKWEVNRQRIDDGDVVQA